MRELRFRALSLGVCLALILANPIAAAEWTRFRDPASQYAIELPTGSFSPAAPGDQRGHLSLAEIDGDGIVDVYGGNNSRRLRPAEFITELSRAPRIADVTYRAMGKTWFAISGHYVREAGDRDDLIYYAKFVFTPDLSRFAAFEISYSTAEKNRMDPVVTHLEKSLRLLR
jgi:hypothetical protein